MPSKPRPKSLGDLLRQAKADAPSASSVVRALLQWAEQEHLGAELVRLIAAELQTGEVVWGKARTRRL
jgi:hypothetical protein